MGLLFINILAVLYLCGFHAVQSCTFSENGNELKKKVQEPLVQNAEQTPASGTSGGIAKGEGTGSMANTPRPGSRGSNTGSVLKREYYGRFKRTVGSGLRYSSKALNKKRCQELMQKMNCFECCKGRPGTKGLPKSFPGTEKRAFDSPSQVQGRRSETSSPSGRKSGKRMSGCLDVKKSVPEESKNDPKEKNNRAAKKSKHRCTSDECRQECDKCLEGCGKCLGGTCKCLGACCHEFCACLPYCCLYCLSC